MWRPSVTARNTYENRTCPLIAVNAVPHSLTCQKTVPHLTAINVSYLTSSAHVRKSQPYIVHAMSDMCVWLCAQGEAACCSDQRAGVSQHCRAECRGDEPAGPRMIDPPRHSRCIAPSRNGENQKPVQESRESWKSVVYKSRVSNE